MKNPCGPDLGIASASNVNHRSAATQLAGHTMSRQLLHSINTLLGALVLLSATAASSSSSSLFCKCTCLTNSTLIPISGPDSWSPKTCTDCNRQFCRDYNLPVCKGVEDEDISTTCFRTSFLISATIFER